jgi:hypothetical protein
MTGTLRNTVLHRLGWCPNSIAMQVQQDTRRVVPARADHGDLSGTAPHGPLYNIAGPGGIEVVLADGKKFRVGTDDPEALLRELRSAANL